MLALRLSETLPIPRLNEWTEALWGASLEKELIGPLAIAGDCLAGYWVHLSEALWVGVITKLLKEAKIVISQNQ